MVSERLPGSRTFSAGIYAGVGSRHEPARAHGASHFLEHVLFKGTARRRAEEISAALDAVGGDLNAYTAKEHTSFYARVLDVDTELAVDVLTDMVGGSLITAPDVDAERAVILDEIAMHADEPSDVAQDLVAAALFGPDGLGRPVIGTQDSIGSLTRRQILGHWRRHYRPDSVVVAAAGGVRHDRLVEALADWRLPGTGPTAATGAATGGSAARAAGGGGLVWVHRPTEQVSAVLALPGPGLFDDRRFPVGLLSAIVGGGMSSRLFVEVRERRGLTYGIDAGETCYTDAGLWAVEWQCAPERLAEITGIVRSILLEVAADGVTESELTRAKGQLRGQTVLAYESPGARMGRLGTSTLLGEKLSLPEVLDRYEAVSGEQVRAAARDLFAFAPVFAAVGPRFPRRRIEGLLARW